MPPRSRRSLAPLQSLATAEDGVASESAEDSWDHARLSVHSGIAGGCLLSVISSLVTGVLLLVNGSFVLALVSVLAENSFPFLDNPSVTQFLLFTLPVAMVVIQWIMIDYVRRRSPKLSRSAMK